MREDGSEFVSGPHVCGYNGQFRPFPRDDHKGCICPVAIRQRLDAIRARALAQARERVRRGEIRPFAHAQH